MSATQILLFAIAGIGALAILSIISIAWRRGDAPSVATPDSAALPQDLATEDQVDEDDGVTAEDEPEFVAVGAALFVTIGQDVLRGMTSLDAQTSAIP